VRYNDTRDARRGEEAARTEQSEAGLVLQDLRTEDSPGFADALQQDKASLEVHYLAS
jgi:hypothetical protein